MKTWFKKFLFHYFWITLLVSTFALLINLAPMVETDITLAEVFIGSLLMAISLTSAIYVYHLRWGNGIGNVILGYVIALPIPFLIRRIFFPILFRFVALIYVLLFIYIAFYLIFIAYHHAKNKKSSEDLNALIQKKKTKKK
jgi:hypothetical protein